MHKAAKAAAKATAPSHWRRFKAKSSRIRGLFIHRLDASILVIPVGMKYVNFGIMDKWDQAVLAEEQATRRACRAGSGCAAVQTSFDQRPTPSYPICGRLLLLAEIAELIDRPCLTGVSVSRQRKHQFGERAGWARSGPRPVNSPLARPGVFNERGMGDAAFDLPDDSSGL
jgi:hypothetical protein